MKITNIKESGCNNILMTVLKQNHSLFNDIALQSVINDELYYLITLDNINLFELFRLTHLYRNRIKILKEDVAKIPDRNILAEYFPGSFKINNESDERAPLLEVAEHASQMMLNLALQITTDQDVIKSGVSKLFLPMISRRFQIQIPLSFIDFISVMNKEECEKIFNKDYPETINTEILSNQLHPVNNLITMQFIKDTSLMKYSDNYFKYLNAFKYSLLNNSETEKIYKFALAGFSKYDNINKVEIRCNLYGADKDDIIKKMKLMARLKTPLQVDFVTQMPIEYIQILENRFSNDELKISYESPINHIIDIGLKYDDFKTHEWDIESEDENELNNIKEFENKISLYKTRIEEANRITLGAITVLMSDNENDIDATAAMSLLPSIYKTTNVITINSDNKDKYLSLFDIEILNMFKDLFNIINSLQNDIEDSIK